MLPPTKGHLLNKDSSVWQKGFPYYRGTTVYYIKHMYIFTTYILLHMHTVVPLFYDHPFSQYKHDLKLKVMGGGEGAH